MDATTQLKYTEDFRGIFSKTKELFALYDTIMEAARYSDANPSLRQSMCQTMEEGIHCITDRVAEYCKENLQTIKEVQQTCLESFNNQSDSFQKIVSIWFQTVGTVLVNHLLQELKKINQIDKELVLSVVSFFYEYKMKGSMFSSFLLELGHRCSTWEPELAFELMMDAFKHTPNLLENLQHIKGYVYEDGKYKQKEFEHCPICGGQGHPYQTACSCYITSFDETFLPAKLWMQCEDCQNLYTRYFPEEFFSLGQEEKTILPTEHVILTQQVSQGSLHMWGEILNKLRKYTTGNDLLEVGVGKGLLIAVAQEMGYNVTAIELLEDRAQNAADLYRLPIIWCNFLKVDTKKKYSVITMGDVIEHLQNPVEGLKKAYDLLEDDGVLWLSTPNYKSAYAQMQKNVDVMWREPYHVTYFSREGLLKVLDMVGFELLEYSLSNHYVDSMELVLRKK